MSQDTEADIPVSSFEKHEPKLALGLSILALFCLLISVTVEMASSTKTLMVLTALVLLSMSVMNQVRYAVRNAPPIEPEEPKS